VSTAEAEADLGSLAAGVRLTPTQRRLVSHLVEHTAELPWLSAGEVATRTGVSQPSVTRLARALGFEGWSDLRASQRRRVARSGSEEPGGAGGRSRSGEARPPGGAGTAPAGRRRPGGLEAEVAALARFGETSPSGEALAAMGVALRRSEPLVVAGFRASAYLASYAAYFAAKVHPSVVALTHGRHEALDGLVSARASGASAALVVCMPRYPAESVAFVADAVGLGYRVLLICDEEMPALPAAASPEWRVAVPVASGPTFDAHPCALVALCLLLDALCDADPTGAEARLDALDAAAAAAGTYWRGVLPRR
jgi:DNA-binding MurR/RpiR family transcriptional regulator